MAEKKSGAARALKRDHRKHAPAKKADKHEASAHRSLAEHRLRCVLVEMAALAGLGSGT